MREFETGDVVRLKSGSPQMTVTRIIGREPTTYQDQLSILLEGFSKGDVVCEWFDGKKLSKETFPASSLEDVS